MRKIANAVFLLGLLPWAVVFVFSVMLFDAPGSESSPLTLALAVAVAAYPLLVAIGFLGSAGFWSLPDPRHWRRHLAFLPLASPLAVVLLVMAIEAWCGGQFDCRR